MRKIKEHCALIQFSDFGLGRGLYLAKALSFLGLNATIITNRPVYAFTQQHQRDLKPDINTKVVDFQIPFGRILYHSVLGRLIVYIIFTILSFIWILMESPRPEILYSRGPHPFTEISCILYKRLKRDVRIISDTTDLWPDTLEYIKMNRILECILIAMGHSINHSIYSKIDAIVALNDIMGKILQERFKRDVYVIYGSIDLEKFKPIDKKDALQVLPREISSIVVRKFVVLYAGIMSPFQNPLIVVDIAEQIQNECRGVIFVVIGSGPLKQTLKKMIKEKSLSNVLILDAVPHELMPFIYNIADLTLLPPPLLSVPKMYEYFILALPKKFIEYAACGKPILCITPPCVASKLCLEWKAGYHILPQDIRKAVSVIRALKENGELKEQLSKNARLLANELFSTESAANILKKVLYDEYCDAV